MIAIKDQPGEEPIGAIFAPSTPPARRRVAARKHSPHWTTSASPRVPMTTCANLSYGEQKLLTVARVLATGAELLLLDEPASGLSAGALDAIMTLLRRLQSEARPSWSSNTTPASCNRSPTTCCSSTKAT